MEHFELKLGVVGDFFGIKTNHVGVADAESGGIKLKIGFFFRGHANANFAFAFDVFVVIIYLLDVVANRNDIDEPVVDQRHNFLEVVLRFKPIANDDDLFGEFALLVQAPDQVYIECRRGFQLHIVLQGFVEHITEMATFGTIAIVVFSIVAQRVHGPRKHVTGFFDLRTDFG